MHRIARTTWKGNYNFAEPGTEFPFFQECFFYVCIFRNYTHGNLVLLNFFLQLLIFLINNQNPF